MAHAEASPRPAALGRGGHFNELACGNGAEQGSRLLKDPLLAPEMARIVVRDLSPHFPGRLQPALADQFVHELHDVQDLGIEVVGVFSLERGETTGTGRDDPLCAGGGLRGGDH